MQELPVTDSGIAQWCKDIFVAKVKCRYEFGLYGLSCKVNTLNREQIETMRISEHPLHVW